MTDRAMNGINATLPVARGGQAPTPPRGAPKAQGLRASRNRNTLRRAVKRNYIAIAQISLRQPPLAHSVGREIPTTLTDVTGHLRPSRTGAGLWRLKCRWEGREKLLAFGRYPEVKLTEARNRRDDAKASIRGGVDPATGLGTGAKPQVGSADFSRTLETMRGTGMLKTGLRWKGHHAANVLLLQDAGCRAEASLQSRRRSQPDQPPCTKA